MSLITVSDAARQVFGVVNEVFTFGGREFPSIVLGEKVWVRGKDGADALEYKDTNQAIRVQVSDCNKQTLAELYEKYDPYTVRPLDHNQNNTIYINEAGIYQLIMRSRKPIAEQFQNWVTNELLPNIRKKYAQQMVDAALAEAKTQLEEKDAQIAYLEQRQLRLEDFSKKTQKLEKTQIFYVATNDAYSAQHRFKCGGVQSRKHLPGRLAVFNDSHAESGKFYYLNVFECVDYTVVEKNLHCLVGAFKDKPGTKKEMMHLNYDDLTDVITTSINSHGANVDYVNERLEGYAKRTVDAAGVVRQPLDLAEISTTTLRLPRGEKIDVSQWNEEQVTQVVSSLVERVVKDEQKCVDWSEVKPQLAQYTGMSLLEWRPRFKNFIEATKKGFMLRIRKQ